MRALVLLFALAYVGLGILQLAAVWSGGEWLGLPSFLAFIVALFLAWTPLIGAVVGVLGAVYAWGWSWLGACALFFWQLPITAAVFLAWMATGGDE